LTATSYKYVDIGISVRSVSSVEIIIGRWITVAIR